MSLNSASSNHNYVKTTYVTLWLLPLEAGSNASLKFRAHFEFQWTPCLLQINASIALPPLLDGQNTDCKKAWAQGSNLIKIFKIPVNHIGMLSNVIYRMKSVKYVS